MAGLNVNGGYMVLIEIAVLTVSALAGWSVAIRRRMKLERLNYSARRLVELTKNEFHPLSAQAWARELLEKELE